MTAASPQPPKTPREVDQVRQIAFANGAKVAANTSGSGRSLINITLSGMDPKSPQFRGMLNAMEFAVRGHFDRGQAFQGMVRFTLKSNLLDIIVRCMK
ncbi:MAG: hypothetical protein FJY55_13855 [Betaproteobacteria bacterium]|nr:hypothetical protein [Betaproteobacteria bacterium]